VCGQLLIRSILVLLFNFEVPLKKNYQTNVAAKKKEKSKKKQKKSNNKEGALCVFSFLLCGGAL
jgi:hypothetical protein